MTSYSLGIDLGTSGIRAAVLDEKGAVLAKARADYGNIDPEHIRADAWWQGVQECLDALTVNMTSLGLDSMNIARIGVDGTSGTMVLVDQNLIPVTRALMYNSSGFHVEAAMIDRFAPSSHITRGTGSALARMMHLQSEDRNKSAAHLLHQADFIAAKLMGQAGWSDENNSLKTGYDPETNSWPEWADKAGVRTDLLPTVVPAGQEIARVSPDVASRFGFSSTAMVHAGTTDSIAAFLACAPLEIGAAVTSLGTTLAIKLLSPSRIDAPEIGLYSHKLGDFWLVGGASNTGGGVLRSFFSVLELDALSRDINPAKASNLDYYPLLRPGERFPINDTELAPRLTPRPNDDAEFLHGLFESMARIEKQCYVEMENLGASYPTSVRTAGGGASNDVWSAIRQRVLQANILLSRQTEAAVGVALLVQRSG